MLEAEPRLRAAREHSNGFRLRADLLNVATRDRLNADSHLRALLLGHNLTLPVRDAELALGQFQAIIVAELDGPPARTLQVQVLGL